MDQNSKVYIAGRGMVGSALLRRLEDAGYRNIVAPMSKELDLRNQSEVKCFFRQEQPDYVFLTAAKVGSVQANIESPLDFLYDNAMIVLNVMRAASVSSVRRLMLIASTAVYPRDASQPVSESSLLTGAFEPSNEAYALAKTVGVKYCQYSSLHDPGKFIAVTPSNIYGPGDKYGARIAHVVPAMIRRFHEAKLAGVNSVTVWGSGKQVREFLYVDDVAEACLLLMDKHEGCGPVNISPGTPTTIAQLAVAVARTVGFSGDIHYDASKPEGAACRTSSIATLRSYGWHPSVSLEEGLGRTYTDYLSTMKQQSIQ